MLKLGNILRMTSIKIVFAMTLTTTDMIRKCSEALKYLVKFKLKVLLNTKSVIIVVAEICAILPNNRGELLTVCFSMVLLERNHIYEM